MAELERQASCTGSPEFKRATGTEATHHSITSFALKSLLPIAEASGIVQANYGTPKISFYSPSGNLIQPEGDSSPESSGSTTTLSTAMTPYYNSSNRSSAHKTLSAPARLPLARPALVPTTTPPTTTASLPVHLKHHHNYWRPERSKIGSCGSFVEPTPAVRGCGGIVRTHSFILRSGTRQSPQKRTKSKSRREPHRSTRSLVHDLRSDAGFYKSRYIALAAQGCGPPPKSKKPGSNNRTHPIDTNQVPSTTEHTSKTPHRSARAADASEERLDKPVLGPFVGHALRICFCQPYDGAGKSVRLDASCTGQECSTLHEAYVTDKDQQAEVDEGMIARPVNPRKTTSRRSQTSRLHTMNRGGRAATVGVRGRRRR
jgi:hypothetical protein